MALIQNDLWGYVFGGTTKSPSFTSNLKLEMKMNVRKTRKLRKSRRSRRSRKSRKSRKIQEIQEI